MSHAIKNRVAKCGHEYAVPVEFHSGRLRLFGECDCKRDQTRANRSRAAFEAAMTRYHSGEMRRTARCGHKVNYHPGPDKRLCADCADVPHNCRYCGVDIRSMRSDAKFCSADCRGMSSGIIFIGPRDQKTCALAECDVTFEPNRPGVRCCSENHGQVLWNRESRARGEQKSVWDDRRRNNHYRRRTMVEATDDNSVEMAAILERDGANCALCSEPVDFSLKWPEPFSQSLDHIRPISRGGSHTLANCQLANLRCNISKGAKVSA